MKPLNIFITGLILSFAITAAVGCGDDDDDGGQSQAGEGGAGDPDPFEIAGSYTDDFATSHQITGDTWTQVADYGTSVFEISQHSNEDGYVIAQNAADNDYNPELWSRFDFVEKDGVLYFCQSAFDAESEQDALDAEPADGSDPANGGCGGPDFAWSELTPE